MICGTPWSTSDSEGRPLCRGQSQFLVKCEQNFIPEGPTVGHAIMSCSQCLEALDDKKTQSDPSQVVDYQRRVSLLLANV